MRLPATRDVPETQHALMRSRQGRQYVEQASEALYQCALQCAADRVPWPPDLDQAHALIWTHLGREEEARLRLLFPEGEEAIPLPPSKLT